MKPSSPWQKSISSPKTQAEACTTKSSFLCALRRFFEHCGTDILVCVGVRIRTHRHECLCHNCSRISINHYPRLCGAEPRCATKVGPQAEECASYMFRSVFFLACPGTYCSFACPPGNRSHICDGR